MGASFPSVSIFRPILHTAVFLHSIYSPKMIDFCQLEVVFLLVCAAIEGFRV